MQSEYSLDNRAIFKRLFLLIKPWLGLVCLGIVGNVLYGLVDASFTYLLKPILDKGFIAKDRHFLQCLPLMIIGLFVLRSLANFTAQYGMHRAGRQVIFQFRWLAFNHILKLPDSFFHHHKRGSLLSIILYSAEQVSSAATEALTSIVQSGFMLLGLLTVMLINSWQLTCIFLLIAPLIQLILKTASRRMRRLSHAIQASIASINTVTQEVLENQQVVRIYGGQQMEQQKFEKAIRDNFHQELKLTVTRVISSSLVQLSAAMALSMIIFLVTNPQSFMQVSAGSFVSLISAMLAMLKPLKELTTVTGKVQRGLAGVQTIFQLLDTPIEAETGHHELLRAQGDISFEKVGLRYEGSKNKVLQDINLTIKANQTIAIVGRSGSGKSSLVNLLPRFYELSEGCIKLDGIDIRALKRSDLRRQFALVSQQVTLFHDTVFHNVAYGMLGQVDKQAVMTALEQAHALEFVEALPQGIDTLVGDNGIMLSGGQRQRLAIARALLADAPILILDEATSALDSESEFAIQQALANLLHRRTTIVIAHRLSTIEQADQIIVLDKGCLAEQGTHQQLLAQQGIYANLHARQFQEHDDE